MSTIGILTIATNHYTEYWKNMVISTQENLFPEHDITFYVFTDQNESLLEFSSQNPNLRIRIFEIDSLGWPEATLLRYETYEKFSKLYSEDILMHLDADMISNSSAELILSGINWESGMIFISHPGYWRDKSGKKRLFTYLISPGMAIRDLYRMIRLGAIGAWETNTNSMAYVPRKDRRNYACGGIWIGQKDQFLNFVSQMALHVRIDLSSGLVARWHDESHLNWWVSNKRSELLPPNLCHDHSYKNLRNIDGIITAVRK